MKNGMKKKIVGHLKDDIETFHEEAFEDKQLIKKLKQSASELKKRNGKKKKVVKRKSKKAKKQ